MGANTAALLDQRRQLLHQAKAIADRAGDAQREFSPSERQQVNDLLERAKALKTQAEGIDPRAQFQAQIAELSALGLNGEMPGAERRGSTTAHGWGRATATKMFSQASEIGRKALVPAGSVVTATPAPAPFAQGRPVPSLLSLIPRQATDSTVVPILQQTTRTNAAAAVAPGAVKPTSVYGLTPVDLPVRVIAHLSDPVDRFVLADSAELSRFLDEEMRYGVLAATEGELVNGDGTGAHLLGLLNTPGTQVQPFDTDAATSVRRAIAALETIGLPAGGVVLSPGAWADIEIDLAASSATTATGTGPLPINAAARTLWGVPVAVSIAVPAGTGIVADFTGSTALYVKDEAVVDWSTPGDTFTKNQVVWRCESRAAFGVLRPPGVVEVALTGA